MKADMDNQFQQQANINQKMKEDMASTVKEILRDALQQKTTVQNIPTQSVAQPKINPQIQATQNTQYQPMYPMIIPSQ